MSPYQVIKVPLYELWVESFNYTREQCINRPASQSEREREREERGETKVRQLTVCRAVNTLIIDLSLMKSVSGFLHVANCSVRFCNVVSYSLKCAFNYMRVCTNMNNTHG